MKCIGNQQNVSATNKMYRQPAKCIGNQQNVSTTSKIHFKFNGVFLFTVS
jgi:hypothetical protein